MMSQYIYLLKEREFIKTKENIYKVGMTMKENHKRFNQYPKGSILLFQIICNDCKNIEKHVVKKFKKTFKQRKDIGNEYFEGDYKNMIDIIYLTIKEENDETEDKTEVVINEEVIKKRKSKKSIIYEIIEEPTNEDKTEDNNKIEDNDSNDESDDESDNGASEDDDYIENSIYKITTYDEWIKYNNIINKVIVTNKKREEGFLKFKGQLWRTLCDKSQNNLNDEHLMGYINHFQNDLLYKKNITNEFITYDDYWKLDELNNDKKSNYNINIRYDVEYNDKEILKDTLNKCYVKKYDFYNLNYYEYVFPIKESSPITSYVIFNSINITFTPVDELISDKILLEEDSGRRFFHVKNIINTNIVDDIFKSLLPIDIINKYKKLTYNLIVKQEEKQIIFYDYNDCLLTSMITDLLHTISNDKFYVYSSKYYNNKTEFKKLIKTHEYRCVVINKYNHINGSIEKQIKDFCNLGFKNIIVCQDNKQNKMYNITNFRKYLNDNKEILMQFIKEENNYVIDNWENKILYDDCIFINDNLLLTNFLKWCCIK